MHDVLVTSGDVPIAVRDFGGDGPGMLVLHGAGGNLAHMTRLARALSPTYRVIAVDLRGHGLSGDGRWNWTDVLADLDAVAGFRLFDEVFARDFLQRQEAVALDAVIDKARLEARFYPSDAAFVDVRFTLFS